MFIKLLETMDRGRVKVYGIMSSCNVAVIYLQHCGIPNYLVTLVAYRVNQKFRTARFSV